MQNLVCKAGSNVRFFVATVPQRARMGATGHGGMRNGVWLGEEWSAAGRNGNESG